MAKDWTEENLDAQIQTEITSGEYWQTQADMWRNKYLEAADEIERLREALQKISDTTKVLAHPEYSETALRLVIKSHGDTARAALKEK